MRRNLADSRRVAQRDIRAGMVLIDGTPADKPARLVDPSQTLTVVGAASPYVSRAGEKLAAALDAFAVPVEGRRCLDAGASTGGFTDCVLQRGASAVVAVDVGTGQLHPRLRADGRVEVREQTDIRSIEPGSLGDAVDLVVADLSFISLRLVLAALAGAAAPGADLLVLVKPQFEAGRELAAKHRGVIRDPVIWRRVLVDVVEDAGREGLGFAGAITSPIEGTGGNVEFIVWLVAGRSSLEPDRVATALDDVVGEAESRGV